MDLPSSAANFDWGRCIFCQNVTPKNKTTCPADSKRSDVGSGYKTLAEIVSGYREIDSLPKNVPVVHWDEGDGIESTLQTHRACWHLSCRKILHATALARLCQKRQHASKYEASVQDNVYDSDDNPSSKQQRLTRSVSGTVATDFTSLCFFCECAGTSKDNLRQAMTDRIDTNVRKCAEILQDNMVLAKLASGDMAAREHRYHSGCLTMYYYRASKVQSVEMPLADAENAGAAVHLNAESLALAEVMGYMEEVRNASRSNPVVFTLSKLTYLYEEQLKRHNVKGLFGVHATRLKMRLLENFPDLTAVKQGKHVLLTFSDHLGIALKNIKESADADAVHLMHTAKIIREEFFSSRFKFKGSFNDNDQQNSVPPALLTLVTMLLEGPGNFDSTDTQAALSISQLIIFNAIKRPRRSAANDEHHRTPIIRHTLNQETPLPLYMGLMLHSATRKRKIVDKCFKMGLSVSYDRVLTILNKLANNVCEQYKCENVVCPPVLRKGLFTVAAADNIDHNLSSSTAQSSFHGTAISLTQFLTTDLVGVQREVLHDFEAASDKVSDIALPVSYSEVPPCNFPKSDPIIPILPVHLDSAASLSTAVGSNGTELEYDWLKSVFACVAENNDPVNVSWSAYHADTDHKQQQPLPISAMMPLFRYSANTPAMIRHSFTVVESVIKHINPNQIPVITYDQPLFALAKQIQWHWSDKFGEDKFVVMLGGLHIEMAALRMLGHWLDGSGWVQCLVRSEVASPGVAESFIHASHVKRTRYAQTVTAAALFICQQRCYSEYCDNTNDNVLTLNEWCSEHEKVSTQFKYWNMVMQLELIVLTFVRSLRERNFELYVESLQNLAPWFFSLDHTHYSRWLSVHLRDMMNLRISHPDVATEFLTGNFSVSKAEKEFSAISIDQVHEQLNAVIKGDGGAIDLIENEAAFGRWIIAGPEVIRLLEDFVDSSTTGSEHHKHHEATPAFQKKYKKDVESLVQVFEEVGNPFLDTNTDDLISIDTGNVAAECVQRSVRTAQELGKTQLRMFFEERFNGSVSIHEPLPRNKLPLFSSMSVSKKQDSKNVKLSELKSDVHLFSRLYIACQARNGDLDEFFGHENQGYPPSISQHGLIRFGTKSDLLTCLENISCSRKDIDQLLVDTIIVDGAVIVQMIRPGCCRNFQEYAKKLFLPYIESLLLKVARLDLVFDVYLKKSLKTQIREKRGTGTRTRVTAVTKIPHNWQEFLRNDTNKTELFHFLAEFLSECQFQKTLVVTYDDNVRVNSQLDVSSIDRCSHEEADTRLLLHCLHAGETGSNTIAIRTVDTDVVVLAIAFFTQLRLQELWIHFGVGKNVRLIAIHELSSVLGPDKSVALPVFHSLTGCDATSSFSGRGKKSAWDAWSSYPVVTEAFLNLSRMGVNDQIDQATVDVLERFVVIMYDRTSECLDLNSCRKHLFTKKSRPLELLPPTSNSFLQHVNRSILQGVFTWGQCLVKEPLLPDPCLWGWRKDGERFLPLWMTNGEIETVSSQLIHCSCKKGCTARCSCVKASLVCTALCMCDGECVR